MAYDYLEWQMYYCDAKRLSNNDDEDYYVDILSINTKRRRYILDVHVSDLNTDGYYEDGTEVSSINMDRELFYILLEGIKREGYIEYTEK